MNMQHRADWATKVLGNTRGRKGKQRNQRTHRDLEGIAEPTDCCIFTWHV